MIIGWRCFLACQALGSVSFEDTSQLETIQSEAFSGCPALVSITIPRRVTVLWAQSFTGCRSLKSVQLADDCELQRI
jgi:hypothetical protein